MPERVCLWMQSVACYFIFQSALLHFCQREVIKNTFSFTWDFYLSGFDCNRREAFRSRGNHV